MAHTYQFFTSSNFYNLAITAVSGVLAPDDYITGGTSGATGVILTVLSTTSTIVLELTATPFQSGETLTSYTGKTATCGTRSAPTMTHLPPNLMIVTKSDTAVDIFRKIADNSSAGVVNPSNTNQWIGLEMLIYIGCQNQTEATIAVSENELVDMETSGDTNTIRIVGNATYTSTLRCGNATYNGHFVLTIDAAASPTNFAVGAKLTGGTSGATCYVVSMTSTTEYICRDLVNAFSSDEIITDDASTPNSIDCAATYPRITKNTDRDNFPPVTAKNGTRIKGNYINGDPSDSWVNFIKITTYGILEFYRSTTQNSNSLACSSFTSEGLIMAFDSHFTNSTAYNSVISGAWYMSNCYFQNIGLDNVTGAGYAIIATVTPSYFDRIFFIGNLGNLYSWGAPSEVSLNGVSMYQTNGELATSCFENGSTNFDCNVVHFINSETNINGILTTFKSDIEILKEVAFKFTCIDEKFNLLPDVNINLKDAYGRALFTQLTATVAASFAAAATTISVSSNTEFPDYGSIPIVIRIGTERMYATKTNDAVSTTIFVVRGQEGTIGHRFRLIGAKIWKSDVAITGSNGKIFHEGLTVNGVTRGAVCYESTNQIYTGSTVYTAYNPFVIKFYKQGYETQKFKLMIAGKVGYNIIIKMRHSVSQGRDEMGTEIY